MPQHPQILISGQVVTTSKVNLRQGAATTDAPVLRKVLAGTTLNVHAIVAGLSVDGNPLWYKTDENAFVWAGGCGPLTPTGTTPAPTPLPTPTPVPVAPAAPRTPIATSAEAPRIPVVIDIYHGNAVDSFAQARAAGVRGIIHKATTGQTGKDKAYTDRRRDAEAAGLLWGAYHWGTSAPVAAQVDNFLMKAQPGENTLVALDYELDAKFQMSFDQAREFLERIHEKLGRRAVLYSGHLIKEKLGNSVDPFFGAHRLWLAEYNPTAKVQKSWPSYWLWQYAEKASTVPGIPGNVAGSIDYNHFNGSEDQLRAEWAS
ncbi:MAG: glycoside hydrolase family 25 protein [Sphingomonas sp.]|uniref:glycoside hydrolase family 25 protein n=1 Tax=Sphingomonas sp. TaxID=28214 RepID=UPI002273760E|nr:glycoside hydrolase family 25 protein [Sphingomonas sp.]MCX8477728.1 glycoside hydrolase family 25 protein [Sphingomonas sp.]